MTIKGILMAALVLFGGAVYGLRTEKMRVVTVCRDSRLFMDGSIDANIEAGGLNFHHSISIFRRHLKDELPLGTIVVEKESPIGSPEDQFSSSGMQFTLFKDRPATKYGVPAHLVADLEKEKVSVDLLCRKK